MTNVNDINNKNAAGNNIILYPSNWLYNAGVVGFLRVLQECGENVENFLKDDGSVEIETNLIKKIFLNRSEKNKPLNKLFLWHWHFVNATYKWAYFSTEYFIFSQLKNIKKGTQKFQILKSILAENLNFENISFDKEIKSIKKELKEISKSSTEEEIFRVAKKVAGIIRDKEDFYKYRKSIGFLFSSGGFYQNLFNPSQFKKVDKFVEKFNIRDIFFQNSQTIIRCAFCSEKKYCIYPVDFQFMSYLFPTLSFINAYWNFNDTSLTGICSLCKFLILHLHLSLTKLSDNSEIFINAPSFKVMWYLNKYAREISEKQKIKQVKEILGISLIEMSRRLYLQLGIWTTMNIEVVSKYRDKIEFFSLPSEIVNLLLDKEIASTLNDIGEFKILNMVLDGKFNEILEMGERIFRISLKPKNERGKNENEFINENIKLEKNRKDLISFSQKLFKLYALINEKLKKEVVYEF